MSNMQQDEVMTIKDVAAFLKVKEQTVYRLAQQGKIPATKIGGQWRFKKSTIEALLDGESSQKNPK